MITRKLIELEPGVQIWVQLGGPKQVLLCLTGSHSGMISYTLDRQATEDLITLLQEGLDVMSMTLKP